MNKIIRWLRKNYHKSLHSFGFYPGLAAILFLGFFIFLYRFESSASAVEIKKNLYWLKLRHADAARTIVSTIAAGIIGLTVFSFSMVMVVISQAASQMSNRILDNLIGNKFQKLTLGFYIGTILCSFFLLMVIDDKGNWGIPSLTIFVLMALTIVDLLLFVSFLNYITQSVRFEKLITWIHTKTIHSLEKCDWGDQISQPQSGKKECTIIHSPVSDYYQGINIHQLLRYAVENDLQMEFLPVKCSYVLKDMPLIKLHSKNPEKEIIEGILANVDFYAGQEIDKNPFYGFLHLTEVAVKALSPGINDPNTAVLSLHALTNLFTHKIDSDPEILLADDKGQFRILVKERSFDELFRTCIYPIWDYGKNDRFIQNAMRQMLDQLKFSDKNRRQTVIFKEFEMFMGGSR